MMTNNSMLITGGTGKTGGQVAQRLLQMGYHVTVASRSGSTSLSGAHAVTFDWMEDSNHSKLLKGVDGLFLVAPLVEVDPYPVMSAFLERAFEAGVKRFVLLSASLIPEGGPAMGQVHKLLRERASEWAVLRPSWFMQNFSTGQHLPTIREEGVIYTATGGGRVPFVDTNDIAEVGVCALADAKPHNTDHIITGPAAISYETAAEVISVACGKEIRHVPLSAEKLTDRWVSLGMSRDYAEMLSSMDMSIADGAEDRTSDSVKQVTGTSARSFEDFVREHADVWR